jgi:hypothetical protein
MFSYILLLSSCQIYVLIKVRSGGLGLVLSQRGWCCLLLKRMQLTCTVCVFVCVCVVDHLSHKERTVSFPQRKPLPRSTANSTVNNFTWFCWARRTESRVPLVQKERVCVLFCWVKPIYCAALLSQILEFRSVV